MKIIDKEKDIYDYLSTMYGIDDRLVYVRNKNIDDKDGFFKLPQQYYSLFNDFSTEYNRPYDEEKNDHAFLCIVDTVYAVKLDRSEYIGASFRIGKGGIKCKIFETPTVKVKHGWRGFIQTPTFIVDKNKTLCDLVGEPIFMFTVSHRRYTEGIELSNFIIPHLKFVGGIETRIDIPQTYQKIEGYIGERVDRVETQETPNEVKIVQAGFDKRISFRHRKG